MTIGGYSINDYWWLFLLIIIDGYFINGYSINGYGWLFH